MRNRFGTGRVSSACLRSSPKLTDMTAPGLMEEAALLVCALAKSPGGTCSARDPVAAVLPAASAARLAGGRPPPSKALSWVPAAAAGAETLLRFSGVLGEAVLAAAAAPPPPPAAAAEPGLSMLKSWEACAG